MFHCINFAGIGARCHNGGECIEGPGLAYSCSCTAGWQGLVCQEDIDECASGPCHNGGVCVDKLASYTCACPMGYTGINCEEEILICSDNPCENNALCLMEEGIPTCYCVPDYHGEKCELQYDECQLGPKCLNGGICIDGIDTFTCSCPPQLTGTLCECHLGRGTILDCSQQTTTISSNTLTSMYLTASNNGSNVYTHPSLQPTKIWTTTSSNIPQQTEVTSGLFNASHLIPEEWQFTSTVVIDSMDDTTTSDSKTKSTTNSHEYTSHFDIIGTSYAPNTTSDDTFYFPEPTDSSISISSSSSNDSNGYSSDNMESSNESLHPKTTQWLFIPTIISPIKHETTDVNDTSDTSSYITRNYDASSTVSEEDEAKTENGNLFWYGVHSTLMPFFTELPEIVVTTKYYHISAKTDNESTENLLSNGYDPSYRPIIASTAPPTISETASTTASTMDTFYTFNTINDSSQSLTSTMTIGNIDNLTYSTQMPTPHHIIVDDNRVYVSKATGRPQIITTWSTAFEPGQGFTTPILSTESSTNDAMNKESKETDNPSATNTYPFRPNNWSVMTSEKDNIPRQTAPPGLLNANTTLSNVPSLPTSSVSPTLLSWESSERIPVVEKTTDATWPTDEEDSANTVSPDTVGQEAIDGTADTTAAATFRPPQADCSRLGGCYNGGTCVTTSEGSRVSSNKRTTVVQYMKR